MSGRRGRHIARSRRPSNPYEPWTLGSHDHILEANPGTAVVGPPCMAYTQQDAPTGSPHQPRSRDRSFVMPKSLRVALVSVAAAMLAALPATTAVAAPT